MSPPECEICGEEIARLYKCKKCDASFCEDCGSISEGLCIDCLEENPEEEEDWGVEEPKSQFKED